MSIATGERSGGHERTAGYPFGVPRDEGSGKVEPSASDGGTVGGRRHRPNRLDGGDHRNPDYPAMVEEAGWELIDGGEEEEEPEEES